MRSGNSRTGPNGHQRRERRKEFEIKNPKWKTEGIPFIFHFGFLISNFAFTNLPFYFYLSKGYNQVSEQRGRDGE
jgi:hypothetical protein